MADEQDNSGLFAEFEEFLNAKNAKEKQERDAEDFDVEIWDEKGRGVRTKRSHAKPFLQSLGIDMDPEPPAEEGKKEPAKARKPATPKAESITRKYFTSKK